MDALQHRPVTLATHGIVAAPHFLAAQAGLDMLKAGGNAIDAAIAASATLQVVYPQLCGLGGDLFILMYDAASEQIYALNASGRSARAATIERYRSLGFDRMPPFGIHSVTIPGCADGWNVAMERFGKLGLERVLQPAIRYAEDGFPVAPSLHVALKRMDTMDYTHRSFREHFMPGGGIPPAGSIMRRPDLARTFRTIGAKGAEAFYRGEIAKAMAAFFASEGSLITEDDLSAHTSEWVTPLSVPFADLTVYELPPNTQGVTALQMLGMIDQLDLGESMLAPDTIHVGVEAKKLAFADRHAYLTDPAHMRVRPEELIESEYLRMRARQIDRHRAQPSPAPGSLTGDTIYLCAADEAGNAVSLIQSNYRGFGSGVVVDGTGIVLQNRGAYFELDPEAANRLEPGKRTLHTLIPSLAMRGGKPAVIFGSMGGDGQPQTHLQVYSALARFGMDIQAAIETPRWLDGASGLGAPEVLNLESRFPSETAEALAARGHNVHIAGAWDSMMGHAHGITIHQQTGVMQGGADPRADSLAAGG